MKNNLNIRNLISESFYNILLENKKQTLIDKLNISDTLADWIIGISDKYAIWFANDFKKSIINSLGNNSAIEPLKKAVLQQMSSNNPSGAALKLINKIKTQKEGEYRYIADWLNGRGSGVAIEQDKINFRELTFDEALIRATQWHNNVVELSKEDVVIEDEDGDVVITFPDGYYWINLGQRYCEKEGEAMGHCGRGEGNLFSLRREGRPFVTADVLSDGTVRQLRGRANTKPKAEYHPYIVKFILSDFVENFDYWDYKKYENFNLSDLTEDQLEKVIEQKPSLVNEDEIFESFPLSKIIEMIRQDELEIYIDNYVNLKERMNKEDLKTLYEEKTKSFNCLLPHLEFKNYKYLNELLGDKFTENGIVLKYDGWDDEYLMDLFYEDDKNAAKSIVNYDLNLDWDDSIFKMNLNKLNIPKISEININKIKDIISKDGVDVEIINNQNDLIEIIEEEDFDDIKDVIKRALSQADLSARESAYFDLFVKSLTDLMGEYKFVDNTLQFMLPYNGFLGILSDELRIDEEINNLSNYIRITDYVESNLGEYLRESDNSSITPLSIDEPHYGVYADADEEYFNELLSEEL
jgi:hypothetical protein